MPNSKKLSLGTFFCLYIAQMMPSSFLMTALQVIMREGHYSLATIGLLHFVRLPWTLKFLWSPFVDRHCVTVGDYKKTIITTELVYAIALLATGLINVHSEMMLVLILFFISMIASATQDIATDALAILSFKKNDRSLLNSMQSMGAFGGTVIGGGVLLMILKSYGWNVVVPCLAIFVLMMIIPLVLNKNIEIETEKPKDRATWTDIFRFFGRREIWPQIGFLLLYYMGIIGVLSMLRPYLVDKGYDMKEIGFLTGIVGTATSFVMAWLSGVIVRRIGIHKARIIIACLIVLAPLYFLAMTFTDFSKAAFVIGIMYIQACYGLATVIVYTTSMQCVRPGREGTDFTIQVVISHLSGLLIAVAAGSIGHLFGYQGLYIVETGIAILSLVYILFVFKGKDGLQTESTDL
ncbi:MAG: MFS transporter [Prevotella sp.]|nr:MFS transporter [Prevotella sp.]